MLTIKKSLFDYLKKKQIDKNKFADFSQRYTRFFDSLVAGQTEEQLKNKLRDFLSSQFPKEVIDSYEGRQHEGAYSRIDLAIGTSKDEPRVIIETKMIGAPDMMGITLGQFNKKALHEILFYYFDLKLNEGKKSVKRLIVTDFLNWFVFDSTSIDNIFGENTEKLFEDFHTRKGQNLSFWNPKTKSFYNDLRDYLDQKPEQLQKLYNQCLYFQLDKKENTLKDLYKFFTLDFLYRKAPLTVHKALDDRFYQEILHIMGLCEVTDKGKKTILPLPPERKESASFLEQTFRLLKRRNHEPSFEVALELVITWFNRILFFKLLETQLANWHPTEASKYRFLSNSKIKSFSELDGVFLEVLSHAEKDRDLIWKDFSLVPFMNSSLFSVSEIEQKTDVFLSALISAPITLYNLNS